MTDLAETEADDEIEPVSEPCFTKFIPFGYQCDVLDFLDEFDYSRCTPEIMLSGSVGSAKSVLLAHIAIKHCIENPGACVAIGRASLPDLKKTLWKEILEHINSGSHGPCLIEKVHYRKKEQTAEIIFSNGSVIEGISWGDGNFQKFRSRKWSMLIIEEFTENKKIEGFELGFKIMKARLRRIPRVKVNILIVATNPDDPEGFEHDYFIEGSKKFDSRFVFYSITRDNTYLDPAYISQLMQDYSVLEAERYLEGKWISLEGKGIYHAYSEEKNFIRDQTFEVDWSEPIHICFDFNTAEGKPQSSTIFQPRRHWFPQTGRFANRFHFFAESIIPDANWCLDNLDDYEARGIFSKQVMNDDGQTETITIPKVIIHGDASGKARTSNSLRSNYDLIKGWFADRRIPAEIQVPLVNPALVKRWTTVNALCENAHKEVRILVYSACPTVNQGMKLAKKKKGAAVEDDSKPYQHVTTCLGYGVVHMKDKEARGTSKTVSMV